MDSGYERLSQQDSMYIMFETPSVHMHIGGTAIFEAGPLLHADGGLDIDRIRAHIASRLHLLPRYRQKLAYTPIQKSLIWVDDPEFDITYHVRHTRLPKPGSIEQLKILIGRLLSQPLRRDKPLWEIWVVEGLEGDRFATVSKTHHSVMDGKAGVSMAAALMSTSPKDTTVQGCPDWVPRRPPKWFEIVQDEAKRRLAMPKDAIEALRAQVTNPQEVVELIKDGAAAVKRTLASGFGGGSKTPLNYEIGPQRRVDWTSFTFDELLEIQEQFGGTMNDVLLATVTGAVRRFLKRRCVRLSGLNFKIVVPVDVRRAGDRASANCVSMWMLKLPVNEAEPVLRLRELIKSAHEVRAAHLEKGMALISQANEWLGIRVFTLAGVGIANLAKPYNLIVTNVPGPSFPLYQLGAKLVEAYPHAPLFHDQGLAVAFFSYCGRVHCGLIADWDLAPELARFVEDLNISLQELSEAATRVRAAKPTKPVRKLRAKGQSAKSTSRKQAAAPGHHKKVSKKNQAALTKKEAGRVASDAVSPTETTTD